MIWKGLKIVWFNISSAISRMCIQSNYTIISYRCWSLLIIDAVKVVGHWRKWREKYFQYHEMNLPYGGRYWTDKNNMFYAFLTSLSDMCRLFRRIWPKFEAKLFIIFIVFSWNTANVWRRYKTCVSKSKFSWNPETKTLQ